MHGAWWPPTEARGAWLACLQVAIRDNVAKLCKADLSVINIKVGAAARLPDGCCSQTMHATATARGGLALSPSPCSA